MSAAPNLRIGELASSTRCSVPTIRYYEEIGLIPKARRSGARQRLYDAESAHLLLFIRRCRDFGFNIDQIRGLVSLTRERERDCIEVRDIAKDHLADVREKLTELKRLELALARFIAACNSRCAGSSAPDCTIFKDLYSNHASAREAPCCPPGTRKPTPSRRRK